jgi:hypothetical protein
MWYRVSGTRYSPHDVVLAFEEYLSADAPGAKRLISASSSNVLPSTDKPGIL